MKTKSNKILTYLLVALTAIFMSVGIILAKPLSNSVSASEPASILQMDEGASIRLEDGHGLKFSAYINDADYQALKNNAEYSDVKFGMLIAPASFAYELNEANVFGEYAKYAWRVYDAENDEFAPYDAIANAEKQQIINIYGQNVKERTDGTWGFSGSVSNLKESSLISAFTARAYIACTTEGGVEYIFADVNNNTVTPVEVAAYVVENAGTLGVNDTQKEWIKTNYVDVVTSDLGVNVSDAGLVKGNTVSLNNQVVKAYPDSGAKLTLPAKSKIASFTLEKVLSNDAVVSTISDVATLIDSDWNLDISSLSEGIYKLTATYNANLSYTIYFDKYVEGTFVWNNLTEDATAAGVKLTNGGDEEYDEAKGVITTSLVSSALGREGNYYRIDGITSTNRGSIGVGIYPVHSKEYYEMFFTVDSDAYLTLDIGAADSTNEENRGAGWTRAGMFQDIESGVIGESGDNYGDRNAFAFNSLNGWDNTIGHIADPTGETEGTVVDGVLLSEVVAAWDAFATTAGTGEMIGYFKGVPGSYSTNGNYTTAVIYIGNVRLASAEYVTEHYFETGIGTGIFEENTSLQTVTNAAYGETVNFAQASNVGDFTYDSSIEGTVASGVNNGALVLKGYYTADKPALDAIVKTGLQTADRIATSLTGEVQKITVSQYIVRDDGIELAILEDGSAVKAVAIDATAAYAANVKTDDGIYVDTANLDGIFTFKIETATEMQEVTFEQKTDAFVWNNLTADPNAEGAKLTDGYSRVNNKGTTVDFTTVAMGKSGSWYRLNAIGGDAESYFVGIGVYPVHSKAYYQEIAEANEGAKFTFDFGIEDCSTNAGVTSGWTYGQLFRNNTVSYSANGDLPYSSVYGGARPWYQASRSGLFMPLAGIVSMFDSFTLASGFTGETNALVGEMLNFNSGSNLLKTTKSNVYVGNFRLTQANYTVEHYFETGAGTGEFAINDTLTETVTGYADTTITANPLTVRGYVFDEDNANAVLSGTNDGSLVLKVYYNYLDTTTKRVLTGLQTGAKHTLSTLSGAIESVSVSQYIVRDDGEDLAILDGGATVKAVAIDATEAYSANVKTDEGIYIDTANLDGIFTFTVSTADATEIITFEQMKEGAFVWNNLTADPNAEGYKLTDSYSRINTKISVSFATDAMGKAGSWYKVNAIGGDDSSYFIGIGIYPVHTKAYYDAMVLANEGAKFTFDFGVEDCSTEAGITSGWIYGQLYRNNTVGFSVNTSLDYSSVYGSTRPWYQASKTSSGNISAIALADFVSMYDYYTMASGFTGQTNTLVGEMLCLNSSSSVLKTVQANVYVGNFRLI